MPAAHSSRLLLLLSGAVFALAGTAHLVLERPGDGSSHLFYVAIALAAIATNAWLGTVAGVAATAVFALGLQTNPGFESAELLTLANGLRAASWIATGLLVGRFAGRNREIVSGLLDLADSDHLTGLRNSRAFERELARRCDGGRRFALLVGDVDGLKEVNDREGHAAGNLLLRRVAGVLRGTLRDDDLIARIGGDEFGLLVDAHDEHDAATLASRLERQLMRRGTPVSFGWAVYPSAGSTPEELFDRADERLYGAKPGSRAASAS